MSNERAQPTFICSMLTTETPEQCVKSVQVENEDTRATSMTCKYM